MSMVVVGMVRLANLSQIEMPVVCHSWYDNLHWHCHYVAQQLLLRGILLRRSQWLWSCVIAAGDTDSEKMDTLRDFH